MRESWYGTKTSARRDLAVWLSSHRSEYPGAKIAPGKPKVKGHSPNRKWIFSVVYGEEGRASAKFFVSESGRVTKVD